MRTCTECGRLISGEPGDAVHATSLGTFHGPCLRIAHDRHEHEEKARADDARERRSAAARARFALHGSPFTPKGAPCVEPGHPWSRR